MRWRVVRPPAITAIHQQWESQLRECQLPRHSHCLPVPHSAAQCGPHQVGDKCSCHHHQGASIFFTSWSARRHYTFYIWKDFLAVHPAAKFTLVPAYLYSAWSVWWSLLQGRQPLLWVLGLAAASALTLIPAWLVDFRCSPSPVQVDFKGLGGSIGRV